MAADICRSNAESIGAQDLIDGSAGRLHLVDSCREKWLVTPITSEKKSCCLIQDAAAYPDLLVEGNDHERGATISRNSAVS